MACPTPHPRRRFSNRPHVDLPPRTYPACPAGPSAASGPSYSLRKSATFHSPSSPSSTDSDPILNIPSLPRRSPTSKRDLEDTIAAGDNSHIAQVIGAVDRSFSELRLFSSEPQQTLASEPPPVPRFMINTRQTPTIPRDTGLPSSPSPLHPVDRPARKHHASDSGIGSSASSVSSALGTGAGFKPVNAANPPTTFKEGKVKTGINGTAMTHAHPSADLQSALSEYGCRQIQKHIILPIIREEKLKDFHSLVSGIPCRVNRREITCLRDLEKVLLWLAPKCSVSKASFLLFCETSIQCIHTTVDYLNERDQIRPTDRPYTNGYFLDLVEQVRQYASMIAASRARSQQGGESSTSNAYDAKVYYSILSNFYSEPRLRLVGGLGETGRPAELVVDQGGRSVSLRTGQEVSADDSPQGTKRAMEWTSDEEAARSMARRRKSAGSVARDEQRCSECEKVFKRPCDLTKHEKTHSRPWKCSEPSCKYHQDGWPTEKERDRHVNDKHSSAPSMFKCQFHPCPYESKRESNCKQHMEKAHGWTYFRSKNNGKNGKRASSGRAPPTPQTTSPASNAFNAPTPDFSDVPMRYDTSPEQSRAIHSPTAASVLPEPFPGEAAAPFHELFGSPGNAAQWNDAAVEYSPIMLNNPGPSRPASLAWDQAGPCSAVPMPEEESLFGQTFNWSEQDPTLTSMPNLQLATPATSVGSHTMDFGNFYAPRSAQPPTSLSPGAQANLMLYSPYSVHGSDHTTGDEGFADFADGPLARPSGDFDLYDAAPPAGTAEPAMPMFNDLPPFEHPTGWSGRGADLAHQLGMPNDMMEE